MHTGCIATHPDHGCAPTTGFPAIALDGGRVAVVDRGPDTGWGGLLITVRIYRADGGEIAALPVVTHDDHASAVDPDTLDFAPAFAAVVADRIALVDAALDGFVALGAVGVLARDAPTASAGGLSARLDQRVVSVVDTATGQPRFRRVLEPSPPDGQPTCGPFPIGEVRVWASRAPPVAVARVTYIGADRCATDRPYLILDPVR